MQTGRRLSAYGRLMRALVVFVLLALATGCGGSEKPEPTPTKDSMASLAAGCDEIAAALSKNNNLFDSAQRQGFVDRLRDIKLDSGPAVGAVVDSLAVQMDVFAADPTAANHREVLMAISAAASVCRAAGSHALD